MWPAGAVISGGWVRLGPGAQEEKEEICPASSFSMKSDMEGEMEIDFYLAAFIASPFSKVMKQDGIRPSTCISDRAPGALS